ncbi:MAG: hypothetical protein ACYC7D_14335 [Nitrososphaerales archaeon]
MRRAVPIGVGVVLLILGVGWAAQGAGIAGGSSLMDNNVTFIYLGGFLAVIGVALILFGAISKAKIRIPSDTERPKPSGSSNI